MSRVDVIVCGFTCSQNNEHSETNFSIGLRITAVVLGLLAIIAGGTILGVMPSLGCLKASYYGLSLLISGVLLALVGFAIRCASVQVENTNPEDTKNEIDRLQIEIEKLGNTYSEMPRDPLKMVFSFLSPQDLGRCSCVNKRWRKYAMSPSLWQAFDLKTISPKIRVFDEHDWIAYAPSELGLDVSDAHPVDNLKVIPKLFKCLSSWKVKEDTGITLLTVPKNLTLSTLQQFAKSPLQGKSVDFILEEASYLNVLLQKINKQPNPHTYKVIIANGMLEEVDSKKHGPCYFKENDKYKTQARKYPDILTASALMLTASVSGYPLKERLPNDDTPSRTLCSDWSSVLMRHTYVYMKNLGLNDYSVIAEYNPTLFLAGQVGYGAQTELTDDFYLPSTSYLRNKKLTIDAILLTLPPN